MHWAMNAESAAKDLVKNLICRYMRGSIQETSPTNAVIAPNSFQI
jgi:hypothetical protein